MFLIIFLVFFALSTPQRVITSDDELEEAILYECSDGTILDVDEYCFGVSNCPNISEHFYCDYDDLKCPDYAYICVSTGCRDKDLVCNGVIDCPNFGHVHDLDESYDHCPPIQSDCGTFHSKDNKDVFPWHAGVWMETEEEGSKIICAASIIAPSYVISAVDCFWNFSTNSLSNATFTITAHLVNDSFQQSRTVKKIYVDKYNDTVKENHINNIAVIQLTAPFEFNNDVTAVCLFDYKMKKVNQIIYNSYVEEMVTWTPGPNSFPHPLRLKLYDRVVEDFNNRFLSNISNEKYLRATTKCGPLSDHGGGIVIYVEEQNRYFLKSILNPPHIVTTISCLYRFLTYILPYLPFIRDSVPFNHPEATTAPPITLSESTSKYRLQAKPSPPEPLFDNCGKFDILDEKSIFPWYGLVWQGREPICALTVIKENLAVSAASCFWNFHTNSLQRKTFVATAGFNGSHFAQFRTIGRIIVQDYFSTEFEIDINNVAILVLEESFDFGSNEVAAACLYSDHLVENIPPPIRGEGIMNSMRSCVHNDDIFQVMMEFVWNTKCKLGVDNLDVWFVPEQYKLCMNVIADLFFQNTCIGQTDTGAGMFVIDGGVYYFRGVLKQPDPNYTNLIFTNILPYIYPIAALRNELNAKPIRLVKDFDDLDEGIFSNVTLNFAFDCDNNNNQQIETNCVQNVTCDQDQDEFSCSRNRTSQRCIFRLCSNQEKLCTGTISCD